MAYGYYGWSGNEQAAGPEIPMTAHRTSDSVFDVALVLDGACEGSATGFGLAGAGVDDSVYNELLQQNTVITKHRSKHQAGKEEEEEAEEQPWASYKDAHQPYVCAQEGEWDYAVEVWPGIDDCEKEGLKSLVDHIFEVQTEFEKKNIDYHLSIQDPVDPGDLVLFGQCRCYVLPRQYRDSERSRLKFLQIFSYDRRYNKALEGYHYKMSVCETLRNPLPSKPYTLPAGDRDGKVTGFNPLNPNGDPTLIPSSPSSRSTSILSPTTRANRLVSPLNFPDGKTVVPKNTQTRMRPVPKPERTVVQNREGKFICTWHNCSSPIKEFRRKCEWSKHMDKHERPYKCRVAGCENILGFTYAGGLLRHEREVHHKHGGPKNPLYCPHKACKRSTSNCFARLENLNEHLRRCHTPSEANVYSEEPDSTNGMQPLSDAVSPLPISPPPAIVMTGPRIGRKRKAEDSYPREEVKRLRSENQELKRKIEAGYLQQKAMMEQIDTLETERTILRRRLIDIEHLNESNSIL